MIEFTLNRGGVSHWISQHTFAFFQPPPIFHTSLMEKSKGNIIFLADTNFLLIYTCQLKFGGEFLTVAVKLNFLISFLVQILQGGSSLWSIDFCLTLELQIIQGGQVFRKERSVFLKFKVKLIFVQIFDDWMLRASLIETVFNVSSIWST